MPFQTLHSKKEKREYDTPAMSNRMMGGTTDTNSSRGEHSNSRVEGSVNAAELTFEDDMLANEAKNWREKDEDDFLDDNPFQKNSLTNSARSFHSSNGSEDRHSSEGIQSRSESTYSFYSNQTLEVSGNSPSNQRRK